LLGVREEERGRLLVPRGGRADALGGRPQLRPVEVERAAEVVGEVGGTHQQRIDLVERGDLLDRRKRARPLDLDDAADALVGARAEVGAGRAVAVAARERRDPAAGTRIANRRAGPRRLGRRADLRHDDPVGARVEHPAGLRGPVRHAHDDGGVAPGRDDLRPRRRLVAGPVLEVDDDGVEAARRGHLRAHGRAEVEERGRQGLAPPQPLTQAGVGHGA
jgi:hypothetical protein